MSPAQDPTLPDDTIIFIIGALNRVPAKKRASLIIYVDSKAERNERSWMVHHRRSWFRLVRMLGEQACP